MPTTTAPPRGVRKSSELIVQKGRTLIFTEEEANEILWSDIPNGSLKINPETGLMSVKIKGESNWVPAGIKNDGTISIARDTRLVTEVYTIVNPDEGDGHFSCENEAGETRHFPLTDDGYPVFYLEKGSYQMLRNQVTVTIDDCLHRSVASGGVIELSETRIQLNEQLKAGQEITIMYSNVVRIGNPYPRIFINDNEPDVAEVGDIWIDGDASLGDDEDDFYETLNNPQNIPWSRIVNTPTTLRGYGIVSPEYTQVGHSHVWLDIVDRPNKLPADGGNSSTVAGHAPGTGPNNIAVLDKSGCILPSMFPTQFLIKSGAFYIQDNKPGVAVDKSLWVCTAASDPHIEVYINHTWTRLR